MDRCARQHGHYPCWSCCTCLQLLDTYPSYHFQSARQWLSDHCHRHCSHHRLRGVNLLHCWSTNVEGMGPGCGGLSLIKHEEISHTYLLKEGMQYRCQR